MHNPNGGVPPHQNKETRKSQGMPEQDIGPWKQLVVTHLERLIAGGRITSPTSIADLRYCAQLLQKKEPTPFEWDTTMYTQPPDVNRERGAPEDEEAKMEAQEDRNLIDLEQEGDGLNEQDEKGTIRPNYKLNEIYLIRLERPPFFGFARCTIATGMCLEYKLVG